MNKYIINGTELLVDIRSNVYTYRRGTWKKAGYWPGLPDKPQKFGFTPAPVDERTPYCRRYHSSIPDTKAGQKWLCQATLLREGGNKWKIVIEAVDEKAPCNPGIVYSTSCDASLIDHDMIQGLMWGRVYNYLSANGAKEENRLYKKLVRNFKTDCDSWVLK